MILNSILLQDAAPAQAGFDWSFILMMVAIFVIFYFFMIRPQNQRQKKIQEARAQIKTGDKVITQGGIYGKVTKINDNTFVLQIAEGVKITVEKACVYPVADSDAAVQDGQQDAELGANK